jgi:hypothetical protein
VIGSPSLDDIGRMIAERVNELTGVDVDEIRHEMGPGRQVPTNGPTEPDWTFDGHAIASEVGAAISQAAREFGTSYPRTAHR